MKTGLRNRIRFTERLAFRLAFLLTVALLPLGMIAVAQTWRIIEQAEHTSQVALQGKTAEAAAGERAMIQTALGVAEALSPAIIETLPDIGACNRLLSDYVRRSSGFAFVGFVGNDGIVACSSAGSGHDVRESSTYRAQTARPAPFVTASATGSLSNRPVVVVSQPLRSGAERLGYIVVSIPQAVLTAIRPHDDAEAPVEIVTFSAGGEILTTYGSREQAERSLPAEISLTDLATGRERTFRAPMRGGGDRVYAVVPVIPGLVHALGSWPPEQASLAPERIGAATLLFPLAMWLASLVVAFYAVYRLVIRHVRELRGQMRRFALGQRDAPPSVLTNAPAEIQDVSQTFHNLARILIRDEAELASSLTEKTVLLKEVHHRVKNNLQLIASIINMQSRKVQEPVARRVLKSVQDRVASLAAVHRTLYQAGSLAAVQADQLLGEIVEQMGAMSMAPGARIAVTTELEPVTLYPDQAVPLSLLATEALTNAIKYSTPPASGGPAWIRVSFTALPQRRARLTIANSCNPAAPDAEGEENGGLGTQLIAAFASQLDAEVERSGTEESYELSVEFRITGLDPAAAG